MHRLSLAPFPFRQARTSIVGAIVCASFLTGCKDAFEPVAPPTDPTNGSIAGFVIDESDQCIIGARVELIDGPQAGAVFVQTVCGFWDYGADLGYSFHDLPFGIPVTVRATAEGYESANRRVAPTNPYSYTTIIVLTKKQ